MKTALVAIQLAIDADVLSSADAYRRHLQAAIARALAEAGPCDARLVVFPEVAGHLAVFALAPPAAHKAKTLAGAFATAAVRRPLDVLRGFSMTRLLDPKHAVLAAIAPDAERWWKGIFGPLAKEHGAYIVAGTHLRVAADGALTNASFLFGPDGFLLATTDKVNLLPGIEDAAKGGLALQRGEPSNVLIVDTPFGKLVTLIDYDAYADAHTPHERFIAMAPRFAGRGITVVANPSANPVAFGPRGTRDMGFAKYGVTALLVGKVLDLAFEGTSEIVAGSRSVAMAAPDRGGHVVAMLDTENV
jgi:predicted amidohydrolase